MEMWLHREDRAATSSLLSGFPAPLSLRADGKAAAVAADHTRGLRGHIRQMAGYKQEVEVRVEGWGGVFSCCS